MCGIAGMVVEPGAEPVNPELLERMCESLRHRGPDGRGVCQRPPAYLVHRRLSILDPAGGHQPMLNADGTHAVVFNGEIYNHPELRRILAAKGHAFRTRSDTETLLAAYQEWGVDALHHLNGMFAFAIWDGPRRRLFAARDRLGKKPFYFYHKDGRFIFGSELKAILAWPDVDRELDLQALDDFLMQSYIEAPATIFVSVRKLRAAHYLTLEGGALTIRRYWSPPVPPAAAETVSDDTVLERFEEIFSRAVRRRLLSDVPLGAFLSGGIDSSLVVSAMAKESQEPVRTFTVDFGDASFFDPSEARAVARRFHTCHEEISVRPVSMETLHDLAWHFDEPFGDSSAVPSYLIAQTAAAHVKVVLTGDGGDELFGGYRRYERSLRPRLSAWIPDEVRRALFGRLSGRLPLGWPGRNRFYAFAHERRLTPGYDLGIYPFVRERLYAPAFLGAVGDFRSRVRCTPSSLSHMDVVSRLQHLDLRSYLPEDILTKVDRASMAHGLETRAPLLDYELVEFVVSLPPRWKVSRGVSKVLLRRMGARTLPPSVMNKPKVGFGSPKTQWLRSEMMGPTREILLDPRALSRGYFVRRTVAQILREHAAGRRNYGRWIWSLLVLELWHRVFMDAATRRI